MAISSIKAKEDRKRTSLEKTADRLTKSFGTVPFLVVHVIWFFTWTLVNSRLIPDLIPFDPFPFGLLTMIVSLEAIFLTVIVLISQNREERINNLRQESNLQLDIQTEKKITKILYLTALLLKKHGLDLKKDEEVQKLIQPVDINKIEKVLEKEIEKNS